MINRMILTIVAVLSLASMANSQTTMTAQKESNLFRDEALGISFAKTGSIQKVDESTYSITLSSEPSAIASVSVSDRVFIDLPGSYGGKYYPDESSAFIKNRVLVDSVQVGQYLYRREYWMVYAGMGTWENVINCSRQEGNQFYIVSLTEDKDFGKPGEFVDGKQVTKEELQMRLLPLMQESNNIVISKFNEFLSSVNFTQTSKGVK
jgi:hypothetical protein